MAEVILFGVLAGFSLAGAVIGFVRYYRDKAKKMAERIKVLEAEKAALQKRVKR
jgi:hypothetical protein